MMRLNPSYAKVLRSSLPKMEEQRSFLVLPNFQLPVSQGSKLALFSCVSRNIEDQFEDDVDLLCHGESLLGPCDSSSKGSLCSGKSYGQDHNGEDISGVSLCYVEKGV
jgi:hypothetical protein